MLALNSKESFENNKDFYRQQANLEDLPAIRKLLEQDSAHRSHPSAYGIQPGVLYSRSATGQKRSPMCSAISPASKKSIRDNGFTVRRATEQDLKRMLGVYFEQNVTTERFEDHDGERWIIFGE